MRQAIVGLAAMLLASVAQAQPVFPNHKTYPTGQLADVAATAAVGARTIAIDMEARRATQGFKFWTFWVSFTRVAATAATMTCTNQVSSFTGAARLQVCDDVTDGTCESTDAVWEKNVATGSAVWVWRVDISGMRGTVSCVFDTTAGGASDIFRVESYLVTGA